MKTGVSVKNAIIKNARLSILIVLFVIFSLFTDTFWSIYNWSNVKNIILQQAPFTILMATSMMLSITISGFDLSIGSGIAAISCAVALVLRYTQNATLAIIFGIFLGILVGLCNGVLIACVRIPTFVATYTMQWILRGVALVLLGGSQIYDFGPDFRNIFISSEYTFLIIMVVLLVLVWFIMTHTNFGRYIYAVGYNKQAADLSGMRVTSVLVLTYVISGVIVSITSMMFIANLGTAESSIGENFNLNAIAAALVGGTMIGGGGGKVSNAVIGGLIMLVLSNGMIQIGVPSVWQQVFVGTVIILSVVMERLLQRFHTDEA